jgi:hypothetical protein
MMVENSLLLDRLIILAVVMMCVDYQVYLFLFNSVFCATVFYD